jgi:hypothetical protein
MIRSSPVCSRKKKNPRKSRPWTAIEPEWRKLQPRWRTKTGIVSRESSVVKSGRKPDHADQNETRIMCCTTTEKRVRKTEPGHRAWSGDWNSAKNNEREGTSNITATGKTSSGICLGEKTRSELHGEILAAQDRNKSDQKKLTHQTRTLTQNYPSDKNAQKKILPHQATEQKFLNQKQTPRSSQNRKEKTNGTTKELGNFFIESKLI